MVQCKEVDAAPEAELVEDIIAITTVFACKHYGKRRYKKIVDTNCEEDTDIPKPEGLDGVEEMVRVVQTDV